MTGTLKAAYIQNPASSDRNISILANNDIVLANNIVVANTTSTGNVTANIITANTVSITNANISGNLTMTGTASIVPSSSFLRNRIINGNMYIAQRGASATVTAGTAVPTISTGYPCLDRWFAYCTGANVTAAQVAGSGNNKNLLQITGAASVTAIGVGQRIEQLNSYDLAGQTCTLSVNIANSLLTTVTWTASYANTADTFGTIGTPTKTQIATGTFTVSSTLTQYTTNIVIPAAATKGIEILFTVGAQTSGTWQVGNVQLEVGSSATPFERRQYGHELALCQRYYETFTTGVTLSASGVCYLPFITNFAVTKRATPTITTQNVSNATATINGIYGIGSIGTNSSSPSASTFTASAEL